MTAVAPNSNPALQALLELLEMERIEVNLFRAQNGPSQHVFGGQVLGQAIVAASRTVEDRHLHSIHGYFLRRGDASTPILFDVDRIRDGSSFTTRRVVGIQHGQAIFNMSSSFQRAEKGLEHQGEMPDVPPPEELQSDRGFYRERAKVDPGVERYSFRYEAIESRQVEGLHMVPRQRREAHEPRKHTWMRTRGALPEDPVVHGSFLAYMSDMDFMSTSMLPHGPELASYTIQGATLDHAMWFHRPFRADEWLLFSKESPSAAGSRGFVRGHFFDREGRLVASTTQECLIRLRERRVDVP
ncbi:MAG: acyl-CoA thioesterase II [Acidobacteriota bacterium]|nr:acyl-CoA thioesterase II [Acidobacteriota bacterium]